MRFKWLKKIWATTLLAITPAIAYAQSAEDQTQNWFYASTQSERTSAYDEIEKQAVKDNTAQFGLGSIQFFSAVESFSQDMLKYGLANHDTPMRDLLPFPLPKNPNPQTLTYEVFRDTLVRFETNLETARATLSSVEQDKPVAISIDFDRAHFNLTAQENISKDMRFSAIIAAVQSTNRPRQRATSSEEPAKKLAPPTFRFDNADAIWLEGYSNVILSQIDFILAHDFKRAFNTNFHLFFPKSNLPLQNALIPEGYKGSRGLLGNNGMIGDAIAFFHLIDWPVIEPNRRADFARHMTQVAQLSRANWAAIAKETDNDHEWLPGPQQPGIHPLTGLEVSQEMVDGWMKSMDMLEQIMAGKRLVPHWRFKDKGVNLKKFFDGKENFNPVLFLTGHGAIPYLEQGDVISTIEWRATQNLVGRRNFGMVAAWFN